MDGNDYNLITPVNSLQNIGTMQHVKHRKERKRKDKHKPQQEAKKKTTDGQATKVIVEEPLFNRDDPHRIDFKA